MSFEHRANGVWSQDAYRHGGQDWRDPPGLWLQGAICHPFPTGSGAPLHTSLHPASCCHQALSCMTLCLDPACALALRVKASDLCHPPPASRLGLEAVCSLDSSILLSLRNTLLPRVTWEEVGSVVGEGD